VKGGSVRRCLLLAGGLDAARNHPRYGRELHWWARELYGRGVECWICLGDGAVVDPMGSVVKQTSARRRDVEDGLAWLAASGPDDVAMLVVSNHGSPAGICLWGPDLLTPVQPAGALGPGQGARLLVMGQCYGGVFAALADERTVVCSACRADEPSWAWADPPGPGYDEFLYQLGTAFFGAPPDAPQDGPAARSLTLADAFAWARAHDRRKETPMMFDPAALATGIAL
jgi:hypothetical protein